ncbi:MAG: MBL fold metallo-hydrolase [Dictyoglomus sp. NZ13-RE01]|nr:MAG: MBL fold metallo-hydrolase [Dictyoglomus sp. NZ13-RE01]
MKKLLFLFSFIIFLFSISYGLEIKYFGHSCFQITFSNGFSIILDPFDRTTGYPIPKTSANLLISSHEHRDHYNPDFLGKKVDVLVGTKNNGKDWNLFNEKIDGIKIWNIGVYHDDKNGSLRGKNSITIIEGEGLKIVHLGDLGTILTEKEIKLLQNVDILFLPVGGYYTLSVKDALTVINQLNPKIVIPMHYKTEFTKSWPISDINEFISLIKTYKTFGNTINVTKENIPQKTEIWVMSL